MHDIGVVIEATKDEIGGVKKLKELSDKFHKELSSAYDAAQMVFKEFPEFKQVTLDTLSDEEQAMLELMEKSNNKN
jgi:hypothetical protein